MKHHTLKTSIVLGKPLLLPFLLLIGVLSFASVEAQDDEGITEARAALSEWVETRKLISSEKKDWLLSQEVLADRIALIKREIEAYRVKIDEARANVTDADARRERLLEEDERLKSTTDVLETICVDLEARTTSLLAKLPQHIQDHLKPITQELPKAVELPLNKRFPNVIGILDQVNKFNRDVMLTSEIRELPDGSKAEVAAIYFGIGYGFYVNGNGDLAGIGTATEEGWNWVPANEHAAAIAAAIRITRNEEVASFVKLPIEVK